MSAIALKFLIVALAALLATGLLVGWDSPVDHHSNTEMCS